MLWSYAEKVAMAREAADLLTPAEARAFLHDNAARIYRLPPVGARSGGTGLSSAAS